MSKTYLYQLANQSHTQMMSYIIQTEQGKLIVIDGGTKADAEFLLATLKKLSKSEKPVISAWFLTHAHSDHIEALIELYRNHREEFSVDTIYQHFPTPEFIKTYDPNCFHSMEDYIEVQPVFKDHEVIVQEKDIIQIDNVTFEILYTTDPAFITNVLNNSSTVIKMQASGCSTMFLGDLGVEGGEKLLKICGKEKLHSDIVQMAHHGQSGVDYPVYEAISPKLCMWCAPLWLWENNQGNRGYNSGPWKIFEVRKWMEQLGVTNHIIHKDGNWLIELEHGTFHTVKW